MVVSVDDALAMSKASWSCDASGDVLVEANTSVSLGIALSPAAAKLRSEQERDDTMNDTIESSRPGVRVPFVKRSPSSVVGIISTKRKAKNDTADREDVTKQRFLVRHDAFRKELCELRYENESLKAIIRQYRSKVRKIQRLSVAAVDRDDTMFERANSALEQGRITENREIKSDAEDDDKRNTVVYRAALDLESD